MEANWLSEEEAAAWRGFVLMNQLVFAQIERDSIADAKLSGADYAVLVTLSEDRTHRVRMTDLANRMVWSKSRLSHQVSRMEKRGLVERETCGVDGRGAWLVLTARGLGTIQTAAPAHVASVRKHFLEALSEAHIRSMAEIATLITERMKPECDKLDCNTVLDPEFDDLRDELPADEE